MTILSITKARAQLYKLVEFLQMGQDPVLITGKKGNVVMVSEDDWRALEETLYLTSIPGMKESIIEGMNTPIEECEENFEL